LIGGDTLLTACGELLLGGGHDVVGVISDAPEVVQWARGKQLAVIDPTSSYLAALRAQPFDYLFSIANLWVIPADALACARKDAINFHEGPLPAYAGVNTPVWALVNGETSWGITWHRMTTDVDAGDIFLGKTFSIASGETTLSLNRKCFAAALETFPELIATLVAGSATTRPQGRTERYHGKHQRLTADAVIDWNKPAASIEALVRALDFGRHSNPMAAPLLLRGKEALVVTRAATGQDATFPGDAPGTVLAASGDGIDVAAGGGVVRLQAFTTQAGEELTPTQAAQRLGLAPGVRLDSLAPSERERLSALAPALSRSESFWIRRLAALEPVTLPFASSSASAPAAGGGAAEALPFAVPAAFRERFAPDLAAALVTGFAVYLARLGRKARFDLALTDAPRASAGLASLVAAETPLAVAIDEAAGFDAALAQLRTELAASGGKPSYLLDVVARYPELRRRQSLRARPVLPVGVSLDVDPATSGTGVLTLAIGAGGQAATLVYDRTALGGEAVQAVAKQLGAVLTAIAANPERPISEIEVPAGAETASAFWKGMLSGFKVAPPPAACSAVKERASRGLRLSRTSSDGLRRLATERGVAVDDCVNGAWAAVLAIRGSEPDVVFGTASGKRSALPLRVVVDEDQPVIALLKAVRARAAAIRQHEQTSPADIRAWNDLPPDTELFETAIVGSDPPVEPGDLEPSSAPLVLVAHDGPELTFTIVHDKGRFDAPAIDRMGDHFLAILNAIAANPGQRVAELPRVSDREKHKLLVEWNDSATDFPRISIHGAIEEQVERTPDAIAVAFRGESLTYRELNRRANRVAHDLRQRGVGPDVMVGIFVERSLEMLVGLLGTLKAGGAYVPMDPLYPPERLAMMLEDSRAPVILTLEGLQKSLPPHRAQVIVLDAAADPPANPAADANPPANTSPENLAYVIFTSGSTGRPKGVQIEHRNVINFFAGMDRSLGHQVPGVWLAVTSISFDISVLELFWTLSRGFKIVLQEEADRAPVTSSASAALQAKGMEFSLFYFAADAGDAGNKYRLLLEGAKYADRNGFAAIWTPERHFHAFGGLYPNPSLTSAAIAVLTERIQIRAGSVVLPLHNPIRAAEEWAVVDNLSGGRVGLSFASGWHAADFALMPGNYADRRKLMADGIETVRALWRGESVPAKSGDGREISVKIFPAPIQREPRIWVTAASSPDTFKLAGKTGANVLTNLLSMKMEELLANIAVYRAAWKEAGHRGQGHVTLMLHTFVGRDLDEVKRKVRGPFLDYLRSSTDLISKARWEQSMFARPDKQRADAPGAPGPAAGPGKGLEDLTPEEMDAMMAHAFERYFKTTGLFGTPESCMEMTEKLRGAGVDEIACLIDFGVDTASVLESLEPLNELRKQCLPRETAGSEDYSVPAQIRRHGVTHLQCTPSLARVLASDGDALESLRPLKKVMLGGEALPSALAATLGEVVSGEILNMYGPTETTVWSTTSRVPKAAGRITIGRPIANTQIYVVDAARRPCPIGVAGEILIGGASVVRGYLDRPELTAEKFVPNPFVSDPTARLYRTGDLGRWLPDGTLDFVGRIDHQVKIRGYRIELGEIESVIGKHPGVSACAVVVREDAPGDKRIVGYVVPRAAGGQENSDASEATSEWQTIWDETYRQAAADPTFNIAGWNSSFDGAPIPEAEMREWVSRTTERILALGPKRVLEIGCGTGLYLFRVAPHCEHYCGVDLSPTALARIAEQLGPLKLPQVSLREKPADDFSGLEPGSFDTVVINSVIQYFPDVDYLLKVIEQAFAVLAPGGSLFIGDVRSLPLLDAFHTAIELHQAADDTSAEDLTGRIERRRLQERELVVDPAFFYALDGVLPGLGEVRIDLKRGAVSNELTRFRYDVVLRKPAAAHTPVEGRRASHDAAASPTFSPGAVAGMLAGAPASLVVTNVLNRHVARERKAAQLLGAGGLRTVADLRAALATQTADDAWGSTPEDFYGLTTDYDVQVTPAASGAQCRIDCFDVVFRHKRASAPVAGPIVAAGARKPWQAYANQPSQRAAKGNLLPELRAYLKGTLPAFMVPTAFVVLDALPLTPNGKIDRKALPAPDRARQESAADYEAPAHELEQIVATVWQELLGLDQVSTVDNLFDLGANSLLVVRANGKLRAALQRDVSLVDMFQYPTVKSLAAFLGQQPADGASAGDPTLEKSHERGQSRRDALLRRRDQRSGVRNN
jgi:natural product biosynthesis luciferase-like monooxygenase protein